MMARHLPRRAFSVGTTEMGGVSVVTSAYAGHVAAFGVSFNTGSRHECAATSGLTALTAKATTAELTAALKPLGAMVTSSVTRGTTSYTVTALKENAAAAAAILASGVGSVPSAGAFAAAQAETLANFGPAFSAAAIKEEMYACAFLDTQMGAPVLGTPSSVSGLTSGKTAFGSVGVVGVGCDASALTSLAALGGASNAAVAACAPAIFTGSDKKITYETQSVARVCFAYEFPGVHSEYTAAAMLLPSILGSIDATSASLAEPVNSHAKLRRDLAEQGAVVSVQPFFDTYSDVSLFGVEFSSKDTKLDDAMWYTCNNLVRLCNEVTEAELVRAKLTFRTEMLAKLASPTAYAAMLGADLATLGRALPPAELIARIDQVDLAAIKATAYKFIHDNDHALAAIGPLHELPDYNWVRTASYNYHY